MAAFLHRAYNFTIEAPFACPELEAGRQPPDVVVTFGTVPETLPEPQQVGAVFEAQPGRFLFFMKGVARYLVEEGRSVVIEPEAGADSDDVRLFLITTCLTVILLQRGEHLTLHASGVGTPEGAILFVGYSGSGKSTLLCEFLRRGRTMLSDDVVPVRLNGSAQVTAQPAFPYMKLCGDAAAAAGLAADSLLRIRQDARVDKFGVPVERFSSAPVPVRAVYVLFPQEPPEITFQVLENVDRMKMLLYRTAGMPFLRGLGLRDWHFRMVTEIGARLGVKRLLRPRKGFGVRDLADAIEADLS